MAFTGTPLPLLVEKTQVQLVFVLTLFIPCNVFVCFYLHLSLPSFQAMICITYYIQSVNEVTTVSLDDKVFKTELPPG